MTSLPRTCRPGCCVAARPERCPCWFTLQTDDHDKDCAAREVGPCDCVKGIVRKSVNGFRDDLDRIGKVRV